MDGAELGRALRTRRAAAGRTIADVATQAGLSVPYVANLENGRGNPTLSALVSLTGALGAPLNLELGDVPDPVDELPEPPASLVRYARTARFGTEVERLAAASGHDPDLVRRRLTRAMAAVATLTPHQPTELDWHRVLDVVVLIALHR